MTSAPVLVAKENIGKLLSNTETFMLDCDGVLWQNHELLPGVPQLIDCLRNKGKNVFFITNNNSKSRRQYLEKFSRLKIDAKEEEIYSAGFAAAYYIKNIAKVGGKVYVLGMPGLVEELDKQGIQHVGFGRDDVTVQDWDDDTAVSLDPEVACVLQGIDPYYSSQKMKKAANYLANKSVLFVATDKDIKTPNRDGVIIPGTGCLILATEVAANRKAIVAGKPEPLIMDCIVKKHGINPLKSCIIGDNINTDIVFGNRSGASTLLVLSGVSSLADVEEEKEQQTGGKSLKIPDYYIESVTAFYDLIKDQC